MFFCFDLFHPYDVLKLLFDFRAAEINTEHIEDVIVWDFWGSEAFLDINRSALALHSSW